MFWHYLIHVNLLFFNLHFTKIRVDNCNNANTIILWVLSCGLCMVYVCHLCTSRHFLCSSGHHTQGVKGKHTQLSGAHCRLHKHTQAKYQTFEGEVHIYPRTSKATHTCTETCSLINRIISLKQRENIQFVMFMMLFLCLFFWRE